MGVEDHTALDALSNAALANLVECLSKSVQERDRVLATVAFEILCERSDRVVPY